MAEKHLLDFEHLISAARNDTPPEINAEQAILATLRGIHINEKKTMFLVAFSTACVTVVMSFAGLIACKNIFDPLLYYINILNS